MVDQNCPVLLVLVPVGGSPAVPANRKTPSPLLPLKMLTVRFLQVASHMVPLLLSSA